MEIGMSMDLKDMSRKELTKLRDKIDSALESLKKKELKTAREAAAKAAAAHGFSLDELTGGAAGKKKKTGPKTKAPAKYKNPADETQTWTGKGRQPQWFKDAMTAGKTPESLEI